MRIVAERGFTEDTNTRSGLQPQPTVDDLAHVWIHARLSISIQMCKRKVESVACFHQMSTVAFDQFVKPLGSSGQGVERMFEFDPAEKILVGSARIDGSGDIQSVSDFGLLFLGHAVVALVSCQARERRLRMGKVG